MAVVTESFILNVTGLLDLTLKHIDKLFHLAFTCSNSGKKIPETCQLYSKLTTKTPEQCLVLLLLTLNIFHSLFYYYYSWIWTNKCQLGLKNYSFRQKICFQNCEKYLVLWAGKIFLATCFHPYLKKDEKDNFSQQAFKKITWTLHVFKREMGYSRKNPNVGGRLRTWNFQEHWKNRMWKFQGYIKKKWNFLGWSRKNHVEVPWTWVLVFGLGNSNIVVTRFCGISRGEASFCLEFPRVKWQI